MEPADLIWQLVEDNHTRFESKYRTSHGAFLRSRHNSYKISVIGNEVIISQVKANIKTTPTFYYDTSEDELLQVDLNNPDSLQIIADWLTGI